VQRLRYLNVHAKLLWCLEVVILISLMVKCDHPTSYEAANGVQRMAKIQDLVLVLVGCLDLVRRKLGTHTWSWAHTHQADRCPFGGEVGREKVGLQITVTKRPINALIKVALILVITLSKSRFRLVLN
jgi:hypothetical protein